MYKKHNDIQIMLLEFQYLQNTKKNKCNLRSCPIKPLYKLTIQLQNSPSIKKKYVMALVREKAKKKTSSKCINTFSSVLNNKSI